MNKVGLISGLVAGALVGTAITVFAGPVSGRQKRRMKRAGSHMFKTVGSMLDTVMYMKH